ncbi:hypothetical protein [Candidatus Vondammii sp. HM_W22]|nr:hypothetical protein [Candidatus Vondammii sp. HM_W22]
MAKLIIDYALVTKEQNREITMSNDLADITLHIDQELSSEDMK